MREMTKQPRTVSQAAVEFNVKPPTVRVMIRQGRLGHIRLGRSIRIPESEIRRVLAQGYVPPKPDSGPAA